MELTRNHVDLATSRRRSSGVRSPDPGPGIRALAVKGLESMFWNQFHSGVHLGVLKDSGQMLRAQA